MPQFNARFLQTRTVETTVEAPTLADAEKLAQAQALEGPRVLTAWKRLTTLDNKLTVVEVSDVE